MGGDDFFDEFGKGEGLFTSEEEHARIREVLLVSNGDGDATQARFRALLTEMAAGRYASLEAAQAVHPLDPYLRAAGDAVAFESMRAEAAAAAKCAEQQKGEEEGGKGTWEPPPEDEEPETAQDYE